MSAASDYHAAYIAFRVSEYRDFLWRHHDLGVVDAKGRRVGIEITTYAVSITPAAKDEAGVRMWHPSKVIFGDAVLTARSQITRDGQPYGGSVGSFETLSPAARDKWIARKIEASRKRFAIP